MMMMKRDEPQLFRYSVLTGKETKSNRKSVLPYCCCCDRQQLGETRRAGENWCICGVQKRGEAQRNSQLDGKRFSAIKRHGSHFHLPLSRFFRPLPGIPSTASWQPNALQSLLLLCLQCLRTRSHKQKRKLIILPATVLMRTNGPHSQHNIFPIIIQI